jgi:hypothetical protein
LTDGPADDPGRRVRPGDGAGPMRYPVRQRRRRGDGPAPVYDVLTPTAREARDRDIAARQRRYLMVMIPCLVLVIFGFFCTFAPTEWRLAALAVGTFMPPIAAMVANT